MSLIRAVKYILEAGPRESLRQFMRLDEVKGGLLIGRDRYGNEYYENLKEKLNRDRWVVLARSDYDATQVPPEWHKWLHKLTDENPSNLPSRPYRWIVSHHVENMTGTTKAFTTYNTTRPKVSAWDPQVKPRA
ncbi:hypothetical protein H4R33_004272 [Dimargaris cristalligena]|uniref:NADH dehydrogenase [ubiquinone] 1 alpha subcomplex subunit n=1 Tax=Dimargaris cristalligena TaxID=215637 RepID=A0A4P9ZYL8_9FUNG|nr:hypothetical protein H4R33_004272 [Dimargaris cristalligena]RKP38042.1 NADH-ubiquinone oxidoreductase subunit [Dimargaris cristalligena]|eukprot:RKP38042.1 NADH-ubiquinone oxidoreductase subunit [Dimargaris cristalligena]